MSLELKSVSFRYRSMRNAVLRDISLRVERGESVALMGPSGRGKSTLLGIAGLMLRPDAGEVLVDDVVRTPRDAPRLLGRKIAVILQTVNLLPRRTVLENVALPLLVGGARRAPAVTRAAECLARLDLDPEEWRKQARKVSGGQAQRVGVARALANRPSVLLADEPTANLDATNARLVGKALLAASKETALLLTTHDEELGAMADRVLRPWD